MSAIVQMVLVLVGCLCASLSADIAVVSDYYCDSLGLDEMKEGADIEKFHSWQYLQYLLQQRGETLVLNNLHDDEKDRLLAPSTTAVIFNNPPWWSGRDLSSLLSSIKAKKILICWEPPTVLPQMYNDQVLSLFDAVLIWDSTRQDNTRVFPILYSCLRPMQKTLKPFSERRLL